MTYSIDATSITFADLALTGSACDPTYVGQGEAVIQALQSSKRFTLFDERLELTDAGGTVQLHSVIEMNAKLRWGDRHRACTESG